MTSVPEEPPPHDGTRLGKELYEAEKKDPVLRSAAWEIHNFANRMRSPQDYAHIDTSDECEQFNVRVQGMCKALLMPDGSCPYADEHGDEFSARS